MNAETMIWLTWRQHRWAITTTSALALFAAYGLVSAELRHFQVTMTLAAFYGLVVQLGFGAVVGAFWGAPLLARELEERTYFVAWGQDVTPAQWLRGKLVVLGLLAAVLAALVGVGDGLGGSEDRSWSMFEANWVVQVGYALLGLAIGVLAGLLTRHTLTAMAATLVCYTVVRTVLAVVARDRYLPVHRSIARWDQNPAVPNDALKIGDGFVGRDLEPVPVPDRCAGLVPNGCMRRTGSAIGTYTDYQPADRIDVFRWIEFGVCAALAAAALWLTFRLLRNGGGWRPSRSHRRDVSTAPVAPAPAQG
ncbi:hypothetical protein ACVDFE_10465 [Lentzea chajnantorensis]